MKPIYWHWVVVKKSTVFIADVCFIWEPRRRIAHTQRPASPMDSGKRVFQRKEWGEWSWGMWSAPVWFLIGWWWDNRTVSRGLMSSDCKLSWSGDCVFHGHHRIIFFHPVWVSVPVKQFEDIGFQDAVICPLRELDLWLCMTDLLFKLSAVLFIPLLFCYYVFTYFNHNSWTKFLFQKRHGRLKLFYKLDTRVEDSGVGWEQVSIEEGLWVMLVYLYWENYFLS